MLNRVILQVTILFFMTQFFGCKNYEKLETVKFVDLVKYSGTWYEVAAFPQSFQKGCFCTTATYTPTDKGYILVENRCRKNSVDGEESYAKGKAFVTPNSGNSKLKVQFFYPVHR